MDVNTTIVTLFSILVLIIPGVIFKRFYFQGAFSRQFGEGPVGDRFYTSVFWGIIIQYITYFTFSKATGVDYNTFRGYLQAAFSQLNDGELPILSRELLIYPVYYFLLSLFFASVVGYSLFHLVRKTKLDIKSPIFRFSNMWNYYFSGEIMLSKEFKSTNTPNNKITSTVIDVLVNYGEGKTKLFTGTLSNYDLDTRGDLETLYLTDVSRYKIMESETKPIIKPIPGDCFVIPYKNVLNMNIQYIFGSASNGDEDTRAKKKWYTYLSSLIGETIQVISFLAILILPWTTDVGLFWKLIGLFTLFFSWLFAITFIRQFRKMTFGVILTTFIMSLVFLLASNFILDLDWVAYLQRSP